MVAAGATRVGASAGVKIVQESKGQKPTAGAGIGLLTRFARQAGPHRGRPEPETESRSPAASNALMSRRRKLASDLPLLQRHGLDPRLHLQRPVGEGVDPEHLDRRKDRRAERRIRLQLRADLRAPRSATWSGSS